WFAALSCVSLYQACAGETSCGCFGKIPINPWYTLIFDLGAVLALWCVRPDATPSPNVRSHRLRFSTLVVAWLLLGIPGGLMMATSSPATLTDEGQILGESEVVVLDPSSWEGLQFPLLRHIDGGLALEQGQWLVVLHRHNCPPCHDAIPLYVQA